MRSHTTSERETRLEKQASRDEDCRKVESGASTWADMNRANAIATGVAKNYRQADKLGWVG